MENNELTNLDFQEPGSERKVRNEGNADDSTTLSTHCASDDKTYMVDLSNMLLESRQNTLAKEEIFTIPKGDNSNDIGEQEATMSPYQLILVLKLCQAAKTANLGALDHLLQIGGKIDGDPTLGHIPLSAAVSYKNVSAFVHLLKKGASVAAKRNGYSVAEEIALGCRWSREEKSAALAVLAAKGVALHPIHLAACMGNRETLMNEIEQGNLMKEDNKGNTLICFLCANGYPDLLREVQVMAASLFSKPNQDGSTPILFAAENGRLETVKWLLTEGGIKVTERSQDASALLMAAFNGHLPVIKWLLQEGGARIDERNKDGATALALAATGGHLEAIQWLTKEGGAKVSDADENQATALLYAAGNCHLPVVQWLLKEGGASITEQNKDGYTAIFYAAGNGYLDVLKWLFQEGGGQARTKSGLTVLIWAAACGHLDCVKWLLSEGGAKITEQDQEGTTALLLAAASGQLEMVQWLLTEGGSQVTEQTNAGMTALLSAARNGHLTTVQWLLKEGGSKITEQNTAGSALLLAANYGHLAVAKWLLLTGGSKIGEQNNNGSTALMCAAAKGHLDTVRWLVKTGNANVTDQDKRGYTALFYAAGNGRLEVVQWLLREGGSKITEKNHQGTTALLWAAGNTSLDLLKWLLAEGGAQITERNVFGDSALLSAAAGGRLENVQWLLQEGGSLPSETNKEGLSLLLIAASKGHAHLLTSLICDFGLPPSLEQLKAAARGVCGPLCQNIDVLQSVCIEYSLRQKILISRHVVADSLQSIFPGVLLEIVTEYLRRDEKEQSQLHEAILANNPVGKEQVKITNPLLAQGDSQGTLKSLWQISRELTQELCDKLVLHSVPCSISDFRCIIRECLVFHKKKISGSCFESVLTSILSEAVSLPPIDELWSSTHEYEEKSPRNEEDKHDSCIASSSSILCEATIPTSPEIKEAPIDDSDEDRANQISEAINEASLASRLSRRMRSLSVQPKRLLQFVKGKQNDSTPEDRTSGSSP